MKINEETIFNYIALFLLICIIGLYLLLYYQFDSILAIVGIILFMPSIFVAVVDARKSINSSPFINKSILKLWIIVTLSYFIPLTANVILLDFFADEAVPEIGFGLWGLSFIVLAIDIVALYFFYQKVVPNGLLVFKYRKFILYLRPFAFDNTEAKITRSIELFSSITKLSVLKIADPNKGLIYREKSWRNPFDEYPLPNNDWKKELGFYISRATYIIAILDTTSGIFWEIFEHEEYVNKFVYYISNKKTIENVLNDSKINKYANTRILYCLKELNNHNDNLDNIAFCIKGNTCYYSYLSDILLLIGNKPKQSAYKSFDIPTPPKGALQHQKNNRIKWINIRDLYWGIEKLLNRQFWLTKSIIVLFVVVLVFMLFYSLPLYVLYQKISMWITKDFHLYENIASHLFYYEFILILGDGTYRWLEEREVVHNIINGKFIYVFRTIRILLLLVPYSIFMFLLLLSYIYCIVIGDMGISDIWGRFIFIFVLLCFNNSIISATWNDRQ